MNLLNKFPNLRNLIPELVEQAEELFESGVEKKEWVVEKINGLVDVPFLPESVEAAIIGVVVDIVVSVFNQYVWNDDGEE